MSGLRLAARALLFAAAALPAAACASNGDSAGTQPGTGASGGSAGHGGAGGVASGSGGAAEGAIGGKAAGATGGVGQGGMPGGSGAAGSAGRSESVGGQGGASGSPSGGAGASGGVSAGAGQPGSGGAGAVAGASASGGRGSGGMTGGAGAGGAAGGQAGSGGKGGAAGAAGSGGTTVTGPCDIYAAGNTPCVAAHSTVRALYGAYSGKLYQVKRASNNATQDISALGPGGFADSAAQDTFCMGTTCTIPIIYDQSAKANHLTVAPAGGNGSADVAANATSLKLKIGGNSVYAIYVSAGVGYRNNATSGIATGSGAEGEYMVASGTHTNDGCCFDYGNAETNSKDNGNGRMEAIYLGKLCWFTPCNGSGPWVMADLENGLFAGANGSTNTNTSVAYDYVTAMLKGNSSGYALKGGNAQMGALKTMYEGGLPTTSGYNPMKKEGAIILGIGGDNSKVAVGTFFEGAMTSGYPSTETDDAVQANIVAAGYGN